MKLNESKLYEQMTLKDRAELAFKCLKHQDEETMDKILLTVPKYLYKLHDAEYRVRLDHLYHTAVMWGFEYWKNASGFGAALYLEAQQNEKQEYLSPRVFKQRMVALHIILDELSESHGLDKETVYVIANTVAEDYPRDLIDVPKDKKMKLFYTKTKADFVDVLEMFERKQNET